MPARHRPTLCVLASAALYACSSASPDLPGSSTGGGYRAGNGGASVGGQGGQSAAGTGLDCAGAQELCGGHCVDETSDDQNCGACGVSCGPKEHCSSGICCAIGSSACDGTCKKLLGDVSNCGACGHVCDASAPVCYAGACIQQERVAVLMGILPTYQATRGQDVIDKLVATGSFSAVDAIDINQQAPSLAQLSAYDALLVFSDDINPCDVCGGIHDAQAVGDTLADYFDAGGRVVIASEANTGKSGILGRFAADYLLFSEGLILNAKPDALGPVNEPESPLLDGVSTLSTELANTDTGVVINGGVIVAGWASGLPLVVRGLVQERNRVDLNLYPISADANVIGWKGDGARLLRNALLFR